MAQLRTLKNLVEEILRNDKLARKDDCYLILQVISRLYPYEVGKNFEAVMFNAKNKGISFESITRCRRKVQEKNSELVDKETFIMRKAKQKEYIEFSKKN